MAGWPYDDTGGGSDDAALLVGASNSSIFNLEPDNPLALVVTLTTTLVVWLITIIFLFSARHCWRFYAKVYAPRAEVPTPIRSGKNKRTKRAGRAAWSPGAGYMDILSHSTRHSASE